MMGRVPRSSGSAARPGGADRDAVDDGPRDRRDGRASATARSAPCPGGQRRRVFLARALAARARPLPPRRAGDRRRRHDPGGPDGRPRGRGARRQDGRRDDPRPGLRRAALPPGGVRERPDRGVRAGQTWSSTRHLLADDVRRPRPRPAGRDGGRLVLDDAHHHDEAPAASATSTRAAADGRRRLPRRPDGLRLHAARPRRGDPRRDRLRGDGRRSSCCGPRVHRRRGQPRRVPGRRHRVHARAPALPRRRGRRGRDGARDRLRVASRPAPLRHRDRRPVRRDVRASASCSVQHDRRLRRATCSATCSATSSGSASATSSRSPSSAAIVLAIVVAAPQGAALRDVRPARRGRVRAAGRRPRVPAPRAARGHDRRQHPGGRDHPGRGDARHARRRRPSCSWSGSTG